MTTKTKYEASLVVASDVLSLSELAALLERPPQSGSHDKDEPHRSGSTWKATVWRQNAGDRNRPFEDQCLGLLNNLPPKWAETLSVAGSNMTARLDVAVYFYTFTFSLALSPTLITELAAKRIGLEMSAYPCQEDNTAPPSSPQ